MKKDKCEIIVVRDRSGSMSSIQNDMEGALKELVKEQSKREGECLFSLFDFDDRFDVIHDAVKIQDVVHVNLVPRGMTALLDAVGKSINLVGERLSKTAEEDRPEVVILAVITDGGENSSKEFTRDKIKEMIALQEEKYNWKFLFLGANMDAVAAGQSFGFSANTSMTYIPNFGGVTGMMSGINNAMTYTRNTLQSYCFTDEDRQSAVLS
jgi:uncharacterized protein YegL